MFQPGEGRGSPITRSLISFYLARVAPRRDRNRSGPPALRPPHPCSHRRIHAQQGNPQPCLLVPPMRCSAEPPSGPLAAWNMMQCRPQQSRVQLLMFCHATISETIVTRHSSLQVSGPGRKRI